MHNSRAGLLVAVTSAFLAAACGSSSSTTSTAPATVPRCGVSINATELAVPASGGSGAIAVTTARECAWIASSTTGWLTLRSSTSGQGNGSVEYAASANADPVTRRGVIELNDQRATITQAPAECVMQLQESSASFSPAGGAGTIGVQASSAQCAWTAVSEAGWLVIRSGSSGTGNGTVAFDVAAASGPPRTATIVVAGLRFAVTQSQGCTYAIAPSSYAPGAGGGAVNVSVSTGAGCPWTAASNVSWAAVAQGASSAGPGTARIVVEPTAGPGRSGSVLVAGQVLGVTQSSGCGYAVDPLAHSFGSGGGAGTSAVATGPGCAWTATSSSPWITLTGATSGVGSGSIAFSVGAVSGPSRTGAIAVAGTDVTVSQAGGCAFAIAPQSQQVDASGGEVTVSVTSASGCDWTATSPTSWITIASGASGSGNGTVKLAVASTTSGPRSGTATIAGQTFTVTQGSGCSVSIAPESTSLGASGGTGSVAVTAGSGCAWTAASNVSWLTISAGTSGSGNGTVQYSAAASSGIERTGTLTIGGQTFTVTQGGGCSFAIAPQNTSVPGSGGTGSVAVTAGTGCAWTATSNDAWLTISAGASGTGNGTVAFSAAATSGAPRAGTLTVAGQTFTVNQGGGCTFAISPQDASVPAGGGPGSVSVTAGTGCAWTASSGASWVTITAGASGSGNGTVAFAAAANSGPSRSAALTIAGQAFTVTQASGCAYGVSPTSIAINALGGSQDIAVTSATGCAWTASSGVSWITVVSGASGTGNGTVQLVMAPNFGGARSGTATVAGQSVMVNQAATLCTWSLNPTSRNAPGNGGSNSFSVVSGAGCPWAAASNDAWITVTSGSSGTGNGTVSYAVAKNETGKGRTGTITAAGLTFTVDQAK